MSVPGKTGLPPCRGVLPVSDGRSMELGCAVVLSFLGQLCTDDAQSTVRGSLDLRHAFHERIFSLFIFFVTPATSIVQVCASLSDHRKTVYSCGASGARPVPYLLSCLHSSVLHPIFPFLKAPAIIPGLYFSTLHHCVRAINISFCI